MDSRIAAVKRAMELAANRRIQAFSIGVTILAILAVLQVNNLSRQAPMCELLANSNLRNADLQRIQIALSQSGLSEFQVEDNCLMVPVEMHAEYLQAVAKQNAIPEELRQRETDTKVGNNPFLSRTQQLAINREHKKQQIREMVLRLPFVEQAWFEMDKSESHSAFEPAEQSGVVSIRTSSNVSLTDHHVDTVKRMIGGAVAGLDSENIVVIDLSAGFARHAYPDTLTARQVHFQRVAMEQQRCYENQIREVLKDYSGIKVSVHVDVKPMPVDNRVASISNSMPARLLANVGEPLPAAGANGFASIEQPPESKPDTGNNGNFELISHSSSDFSTELEKKISVSIDVPQELVHDLFGVPPASSSFATSPEDLQTKMTNDIDVKFERLRSEVIQKVQPILAQSKNQSDPAVPVTVNLIRLPLQNSPQWLSQAQDLAVQNWPSIAVLVLGLLLLSIVTRKSDVFQQTANDGSINESGDILSINSTATGELGSPENPETKLTKLIEKDPDAAARVIEAWIRDAA